MTYLITPPLFTFVFQVFILSPAACCSWCWKPKALVRREGLFIKWTTTFKAELPQGVFLLALLKAAFSRDRSGEKRFPLLKMPVCVPDRSLNTASWTLLLPADKGLHALEQQLGTDAGVTVNRDTST